jgi:hypothetical protein
VAGSEDIHAAVGPALETLRTLRERAAHWESIAEAADRGFGEVTTATSRDEPGQALDALRAARDTAGRIAAICSVAIEDGDAYLAGV